MNVSSCDTLPRTPVKQKKSKTYLVVTPDSSPRCNNSSSYTSGRRLSFTESIEKGLVLHVRDTSILRPEKIKSKNINLFLSIFKEERQKMANSNDRDIVISAARKLRKEKNRLTCLFRFDHLPFDQHWPSSTSSRKSGVSESFNRISPADKSSNTSPRSHIIGGEDSSGNIIAHNSRFISVSDITSADKDSRNYCKDQSYLIIFDIEKIKENNRKTRLISTKEIVKEIRESSNGEKNKAIERAYKNAEWLIDGEVEKSCFFCIRLNKKDLSWL